MAQIIGKVFKHLPNQSGEGKNGPWEKGGIVIEENVEKYPKKIAFTVWGDLVAVCDRINEGTDVRVFFELESREYQDKWYTDAKAFKVEVNKNGSWVVPDGLHTPEPKPVETKSNDTFVQNQDDDLPF